MFISLRPYVAKEKSRLTALQSTKGLLPAETKPTFLLKATSLQSGIRLEFHAKYCAYLDRTTPHNRRGPMNLDLNIR
jgi:hypothetical protein